jgi:hypothetical protein
VAIAWKTEGLDRLQAPARELWKQVGQHIPEPGSNVRMIPVTQTLQICVPEDAWYRDAHQERADGLLAELETAVDNGRTGRARRLRAAWLHQVHLDRVSFVRDVARERGLRLDPVGRGPIIDHPTVHYRDRLPWYLTPVDRYADARLPDRAVSVLDAWNGCGSTFDGIFTADQPVSSGHFPVHCLIGAIAPQGRTGDWFVLDRWAS